MPVALTEMRELLLSGLYQRYSYAYMDWRAMYGTLDTAIATPHIWVPKLTIPEVVAVGAAAAIIKNPIITRRFWKGWT